MTGDEFRPPDYMAMAQQYRGENERCSGCGTEKIVLTRGANMCPICDNPTVGEAAWFTEWGNEGPPQ
jgi:hypothetical protein